MHSTITEVTLHRVVSDGVVILPAEAVAIVRQLWRAVDAAQRDGTHGRLPPLDHVRLRSTGELRVTDEPWSGGCEGPNTAESTTALGTTLATLLSPGRAEWAAIPAQLRAIVRRAMPADAVSASDPNAARFISVESFLKALDDFVSADQRSDLRLLFQRWHTLATAQLRSPDEAAADTPLSNTVVTSDAVMSEAGLDEPDGRVDDALALFDSEGSVELEPSEPWLSPSAVDSPSEAPVARRIAHSRRAAVTTWMVAALAVAAAAAVFLRWSPGRPSISEAPTVTVRSSEPGPIMPAPTTGTVPPALPTLPAAGPAALERSIEKHRRGAESGRTSSGVAAAERPPYTIPVPIIRSADLDNEPAYSPSFDDNESAMFFHAGKAGSLLKASMNDDGSVLEVTTIVNDGARNYHVRASPDGSRIAFDSDRDGERAVYVATRDGQNVRRVSGPGYAAVPTWSPDSTRLAFIRAEPGRPRVWNVWTAEIVTSELRRLTSHSVGQAWGGSWFPDGRHLAYSHEDRLVMLDTITGAERVFPSPVKGRLVRTPAVSPDGRSVVFQVFRQGTWLLDVSSGAMRRILEDPSAEEFAWSPDGRRIAFHSRRSGEWGIWMMAPGQ